VLGVLFDRRMSDNQHSRRLSSIPPTVGRKIYETAGHELIHVYWGRYIAFIRDQSASRAWVLQDPSAGFSLFHTEREGVHLYFSDLDDVRALGAVSFSLNRDYLSAYVLHSSPPASCKLTNCKEASVICTMGRV
jgi:hypothetical protein